jgi:spore maturation protein CgeB
MRIFYAVPEAATSAVGSRIWSRNLYDSLAGMGHEVVEFRYDLDRAFERIDAKIEANRVFIEKNRPLLSSELLRQIRDSHSYQRIDLFFAYLTDALVLPAIIDTIRGMGIVTLNWYCNASYQFDLVREIAPHFDWCLVPERNRLSYYEAAGAHPIYCPEAANPDYYRPLCVTRDIPVSFVGQAYGERPELARRLAEANIPIKVFGPRWQDYLRIGKFFGLVERRYGHLQLPRRIYGGVIPDDQLVLVFNRTQINLGFSAVWKEGPRELQVRLRDFEIPMCGAFYLVEYQPELEEYFDIGNEIECYRDLDDLIEKIRHYLVRPELCQSIGRAARARCLRDHTWAHRFSTVFEKIGIRSVGEGQKPLDPRIRDDS